MDCRPTDGAECNSMLQRIARSWHRIVATNTVHWHSRRGSETSGDAHGALKSRQLMPRDWSSFDALSWKLSKAAGSSNESIKYRYMRKIQWILEEVVSHGGYEFCTRVVHHLCSVYHIIEDAIIEYFRMYGHAAINIVFIWGASVASTGKRMVCITIWNTKETRPR